jgi:hypothetical protein
MRTVSAGLNGSLDIPNALHGDTVLIIFVHVLVLQLANLVQQHAQLVGDVGNVLVAVFAPNGQLLLRGQ